jgi:hypothetical protein
MATQIVCTYTITNTGPLNSTTLSASLSGVPLPASFLSINGLRVISDNTAGLVRTITLGMDAATPSTVALTLQNNETGILSATPSVGTGYVRPPVLTVVPGAGSAVTVPAKLVPNLGAVSATIGNMGALYSANTTVIATGGELAPGGVQSTWTPTIAGGAITVLVPATAGGPYNSPPTLTAVDPAGTGSGAILSCNLGLTTVSVTTHGKGYTSALCTVTPYFEALYQTAAAQAAAVANFFTQTLQLASVSPVLAGAPVVS